MTTQAHVLVPVDGSAAAKRAVGYAAKLAERLGARISFAHVQAPSRSLVELTATDEAAKAMLASIAAVYPAMNAPTSFVIGNDIACAICDAFPDAIVVVGSDHASRRAAGGKQSVAEALVREAHHHPILVVGPRAQTEALEGPIAIALDGSKAAEAALLAALAWTGVFATPLQLLQVVATTQVTHNDPVQPPTDYLKSVQTRLRGGGVTAECFTVVDDDPVAGLIRHLTHHRCSLVVMSTHARQGVERVALGSVTMGVIEASPCAVCAVNPEQLDQPALTAGPPADHARLMPRPGL
ncbi:MAG TPA: universal stress protein [Acidimicrobiales bacterium]|nr:universal stress protein [Acidimicrobiales bacterium]